MMRAVVAAGFVCLSAGRLWAQPAAMQGFAIRTVVSGRTTGSEGLQDILPGQGAFGSEYLYFLEGQRLWRVPISGGTPTSFAPINGGITGNMTYGFGGDIFVVGARGHLFRVTPSGQVTLFCYQCASDSVTFAVEGLAYSSGGAFGQYLYMSAPAANSTVRRIDSAANVTQFAIDNSPGRILMANPAGLAFTLGGSFGSYLGFVSNGDQGIIDSNGSLAGYFGVANCGADTFAYAQPTSAFGDFYYSACAGAGYTGNLIRQRNASNTAIVFANKFAGFTTPGTTGLKFSPDGETLYVTDDAAGAIYAIDPLPASLPVPTIASPPNGSVFQNSVMDFRWNAVPATGYELRLIEASTPQQFAVKLDSTNTNAVYTIPTGDYTMELRACAYLGCGPAAVSRFKVLPPAVPTVAPTGLNCLVSNLSGQNQLNCTWNAVTGASFYGVNVVQQGTGPGGGALTVAGRQAGTPSISLLIPNGAAGVVVRACTGDGCGPYCPEFKINPQFGNPSAPVLGEPFGGASVDSGSEAPRVFFSWSRIPGDTGSNVTYRLYVQDFYRNRAALDVLTTQNFYSAYFNPGTRYDALVVANPGGAERLSLPSAFLVRGRVPRAPVATEPTYGSTVARDAQGKVHVAWTPIINQDGTVSTRKYQYFFNGPSQISGSTTGIALDAVFAPGAWLGVMRACLNGTSCADNSDSGWGPWNNVPSSEGGQAGFTVTN